MSTEQSQDLPTSGLQLNSLITESAELILSLASVPVQAPGPDQVLVQVAAAPINPSDLGLLVGPADMSTAVASGTADNPVITAKVPEQFMPAMRPRVGEDMPVGNEGGGVVIAAGSSDAAQAMLGKTVGILGGASYSQYRTLHVAQVFGVVRWYNPARRRCMFCESPDCTCDGRNYAYGKPYRVGSYRSGFKPGSNVAEDLH